MNVNISSINIYTLNTCSLLLGTVDHHSMYLHVCLLLLQDRNTFHRFDKFNSKYNPIGMCVMYNVRILCMYVIITVMSIIHMVYNQRLDYASHFDAKYNI